MSTLSNGGDTEGSSEGASGASDGVGTRGLLGSSEAEQGGDTPVGVPESAESSDEGLHTEGYRGSSRSDSEAERGDDAVGGSEHESRSGHGVVGRSAGQEDSGAGAGSSATSDGRGSRSVEDNKRYSNAEIAELVSSVTDVVDGLVVLTGDVTDELRRAVSSYRSGGVAKSGRGVLDEYYTPRGVVSFVKRVLDGLPEIGDAKRPALILEPSVGVGNFLDGITNLASRSALIRAYEVNEISARIAKVLHPEANVRIAPFESLFMDERGGKRKPESMGEYDLVLGNPPYGDHRGKYRGLGEEPSIARYEDYFVKRSLDLLREGGVLAMVLPSGWLNRHKVERGWRIEVAYRLPNGVFAGTDVGTDVVVLRKDSKYKGEGSHNYFESHPDHVLGELATRKNRYGREEEYVAWSDKSEVLRGAEAQESERSEVSERSEGAVTSKSSEVSEQSDAQSGGDVATSNSEQSVSNESDVDRSYGSEWFKEKNGHYLGFLDYLHSQGKSDEEVRRVVEELDGFLARVGRKDDEPLVDYWVRRWRCCELRGVVQDNGVPGEMSFSPRGVSGVYRIWEWNNGERKLSNQVTKAEYDFVDYLMGLNDIAKRRVSGDVDANGNPFVLNSEWSPVFGYTYESQGVPAAAIRLSVGTHGDRGMSYGLSHIESRYGSEIRSAGYYSALDLIEDVANKYTRIRRGKALKGGDSTYLLEMPDGDNTFFVELAPSGFSWIVTSAGVVKADDSNNKDVVWSSHAVGDGMSRAQDSELSGSSEQSDGAVTPESDGAEESGAGVSSGTSVSSDEGGIAKGETGEESGTVDEKGKSKRNGKALNATQTTPNTQAKSEEKDGANAVEEKEDSKKKGKSKEKEKSKGKRKGSGLPKIKRGQIKYTLSKGDEVVNASDQFIKSFTEEEMSAFADCDLGGYLSHPEAHPSVACYVGDGRWMHRFYYCSGNIYARLENLERLYASGQIEENQYLGQKALLEAVLPSYKDLGHIYLTPNVEFVKSLMLPIMSGSATVGEKSLKDRFLEYVEELPYDAFGRSSKWEVRSYIENRPVRGGDKAENAAERRRRKDVGDRLFREFLEHELTDFEQQVVEREFNHAYNGTYTPDYTGVPMFSQINKNFHGKPLQLTSVQLAGVGRMSMRGVGVLAHEVGFGKTLSGVLSAHEAMTRGHAKRPLIVCPNDSILEQWVETIYEALPEAKINVLGNLGASYDLTDFSVGEGEITLVTYEGLKRMGFKDETYDRMAGEFTYIQEDLKTHQLSARDKAKKEAQVDRLVGRMMRGARQEYSFEDLGFDFMVFDEVHNANHIVGKVRLDKNVASDFRSQSQRTSDLGIKTWLAAQWIQSQNSGRNVVLLSATPFTNKPLEYYSVLSLVANDRLKELGFYRVEQFFETFMEAEPDLEIGADGAVTERMAVRRFKNNAVFNNLLREFVDVKGVEDNPNLVRPERYVKEYKVPQNDMTRDAMTALSVMLTDDKQKLAGIGHARLIAFSPYASGASGFTARNYKEFVEGSPKLLATMRLVAESKRGNESSGQLIYSELGIEYFDLLREYLIREVGYKEDEVVILSGKTSISERGRIQKGFNDGQIKVVLGSPAIKEGVNLQRNATDLYILSLPWNFTQLIQVEGRCWRQGNQWHHLRVNYMLTEDSADVFMLQKLQTKQRLYEEAMRADADIVDVGDIDAEELKMDLIRDPKSRASFATAEKRKELQHERETLVAEQSVLSDALTTYNESQSRADSMESRLVANMGRYSSWEVSTQKSLIKKEREKADRAKARLERKVGAVERAEGRISDLTRDIADVDKRLEGLEQYYDDLVVSYAELEQSRQANRSFDEVVGGFVEERKQENSGDFYTKFTDEEQNKRVRFRRVEGGEESELEAVNGRFNAELSEQIGGRQAEGHVYRLGMPSAVLRGAGVPNLPIELSASRLRSKSEQSNHPFDMSAVRDLPIALSRPLAVFDYGDGSKSQNVIVELESGGKNFLVGIFFNQHRDAIEVNSIRGLFPKDTSEWLNWVTQGKLRYVDKKRVLNQIVQRRINLADVDYLDLELATKVVKEFENPKESERESRSYQSDRSHQSDREAQSGSAEETARDVVERGVRKRRYRRRREADRELMGRKLSPTERAFVGRMERLRERYGQSVSLDAGGTMWGLSGVMDNSLVQRRERVKTEWVDATNPIRVYEERVGALSGRPVKGSRSVWMRYNQTSSRVTSKIEELEGGVYRELAQKLREVSRRLGLTGEQLDDYLFAKHAPERNAYMRRRGVEQRLAKLDAKHADDPLWLDSSERRKAEAKYKAKEAELEYAYETQLGEDIPVHFAGHELLDGVEGVADLVERFEEAMRSRGLSVEELWKAVRAVNDAILVVWRDCGMMSQESYEAVSGMYEWYVPMQGFDEESRGDYEYMHDHVGGFVQPIQRAKGRVSRPDRPLLAMYRKIRSAVIGGYHNVEKQAFYGLVSSYPSDYTSLGRQYYSVGEDGLLTPLYPSGFASEDIEEFEDRMREGLADGTVTLVRTRSARVAYITDARSLGEHVVKVMIGGREHLVFVNGRPDLAQAVNRINVSEDTDVERFAKGLLRGMAQNVTSRNPNFMIVNLLRDAQMSLAVNFLKRGGVYTRAYMRNYLRVSPLILGRIWGKGRTGVGVSSDVDAYWDEFKRFGGQTGYARLLSEHKARRRVNSLLDAGGKGRAVRVGEDVLNLFARPNEMIESWGRFATYVTSREMGRSVTESISDAKEVSVNFNRKGAGRSGLYRLIGACQMFFNAGVQGMNLAYGVAVENPLGFSAVVASLMVLGYAVAALQDGDDDHGDVYRAINPAVRKSNLCFVVDKDSYVKVPLAIEMRAFYGIGQELYGLVSGKKDAVEAVLGSMDSMGEIVAYNPTNGASPLAGMVDGQRRGESVGSSLYRGGRGFVPAQIQPITDLLANQNFYGGALRWESRYVDRSLPLYKRLPKHTPEWQVSVSKWINGIGQDKYVSEWRHGVLSPLSDPLVYSYLCSQYFGGIVQMLDQVDRALAAEGVRGTVSASPVTNRFYRYDDSLRGRGIEERFWELRRDVESRSKVQRGMRESLEGARSMREYDARSRSIVEYGGGVDYEMLEGWFKDFDKLYKEYKGHRGMLTDEEDRAWRGELQQVEAEMYSEIRGYMMEVRN